MDSAWYPAEQPLLPDWWWLMVLISKLCYLIQLWGGAEAYLLKSLQVLQNRAARAVTGCSCFTSTKTLLQKCNWLSVQQLIFYQSVILAHKIVTTGSPYYLAQKMSTSHPYRTRQGSTGSIRFGENFSYKSTLAQNSFGIRQQPSTMASQQISEHLLPCPSSSPNWRSGWPTTFQ